MSNVYALKEKKISPKSTAIKPRKASEMVKPQEMIEMVEMAPLSLASRRIYNLLVKNAWKKIDEVDQHSIEKKALRHGMGNATERLGQTIKEIMAVVVERRIGRQVQRFHLLGHNIDDDEENDDEALFHYTFPEPLRKIVRQSEVWARLESHVIYAFSSKYALALYELIALRSNLKHKTNEIFELEKFRAMIGVEEGKLREFKHFKIRALDYAVREINALCPEFNVKVEAELTGRKATAVKVTWWPKSNHEKAVSLKEITTSKVGRQERLAGIVEHIVEPTMIERPAARSQPLRRIYNTNLTPDDIQAGRDKLKTLSIDRDIYDVQSDWEQHIERIGSTVKNPRLYFLGYIDLIAKQKQTVTN